MPLGKKPIKSKWVFATKTNLDGNIIRCKARLVAKGYSQKAGVDYEQTFAPMIKYTSIRFCLSLAAQLNLNISQMDAVTAYLNGVLKEEVYMEQPEMFSDGSAKVCKLIKSIYGLKQSGRNWNGLLNSTVVWVETFESGSMYLSYEAKRQNTYCVDICRQFPDYVQRSRFRTRIEKSFVQQIQNEMFGRGWLNSGNESNT